MVTPPPPRADAARSAEEYRILLDTRRADIEEARLALDRSFSKLWGPIIVPALVGLTTVLVTALITSGQSQLAAEQTRRAQDAQAQQTAREATRAEQQRQMENGRAAVTLYFDKLNDLRSKDTLTTQEGERYVADMRLIQALSGSPEIKAILDSKWLAISKANSTPSAAPQDNVAAVRPGSPDLIAPPADSRYTASQFIAFPQAVEGRPVQDIARMTGALESLGFNVQATQHIARDRSPRPNQVRYYRADHKQLALQVAAELTKRLCAPVQVNRLANASLPNGVMEVWLGFGADQIMPANCPA